MFVLCAVFHFAIPFALSFYPPLVNLETDLKDVPLTSTQDEQQMKKKEKKET